VGLSVCVNMSTTPLEYAPPLPLLKRKRTRRVIAIVLILAITITAYVQRRNIEFYYRQAQLLRAQRAWRNFSPPPTQVVYDDDAVNVAALNALLAQPHYKRMQFPHGSAVVWNPPEFDELWFRTTGRPPGTTAVLFMRERLTPAGERFILTCEFTSMGYGIPIATGSTGSPMAMIHINEIRPATWRRRLQRRNGVGRPLPAEIQRAIEAGKHLRIFAGQADPNDPTHYTIRCEIDGVERILDGYEADRTVDAAGVPTPGLRLELRRAATQPSPD
jgi:hypothetical protein